MTNVAFIHVKACDFSGEDYAIIDDATVVVKNGLIEWVGPSSQAPELDGFSIIDGKHQVLTPGLIDCHTHSVYGKSRANEFEDRLNGASYEQIHQRGGGIYASVADLRLTSKEDLLASSLKRVHAMIKNGVTSLEIKSGYGLDLENEQKMLEVAQAISERLGLDIQKTFLGAHTLAPEYQDMQAYIDYLVDTMLPALVEHKLVDAVDGFCESIGFSADHLDKLFTRAKRLGLPVKGHVEQLSQCGGLEVALTHQALSVDHLEYLSAAQVKALAKTETVAVLLPSAYYFLQQTQPPPIQALREAGVAMAVATDCNPGSSANASLLTCANMGCVLFGLTPFEAWKGMTTAASKALGFTHVGQLKPGFQADLALWEVDHPREVIAHLGFDPLIASYKQGRRLYAKESV